MQMFAMTMRLSKLTEKYQNRWKCQHIGNRSAAGWKCV